MRQHVITNVGKKRYEALMSDSNPTFTSSKSLDLVHRGNLCAGCGGCVLAAPGKVEMVMEDPGFLRPMQSAEISTDEETLISIICPGLGQTVEAEDRIDDVLWGPYVSMQTGWANDAALRHKASSGGALSAVLTHLLTSKTVDAIIQTAASPDVSVANITVLSETPEDIFQASGSRYAPSAPLAGLESHLNSDRQFAFVGKPCDVAALRALALKDSRVDKRISVMISFFCAGVPSQTGAELILKQLGTNLSTTTAFSYRGNGWPGRATATLTDGSQRSMTYSDSWGKILSNHVQLRCKVCADGTGIAADIVCADAWDTDANGYPLFEEMDGVSLIVTRTSKGEAILNGCEDAEALTLGSFSLSKLTDIQTGQTGRRKALFARLAGLKLQGRPIPQYKGLHIVAAGRQNKLSTNLKNFLGILRRGMTGKLR